jgi:hypothetical protein
MGITSLLPERSLFSRGLERCRFTYDNTGIQVVPRGKQKEERW